MSYTLVLNSSNVVSGTSNNTYQYKFILGSLKLKNYEMAISSFVLPYSWFNVTSLYQPACAKRLHSFLFSNENVRIQKPMNVAVADRTININTCASRLSSAESSLFCCRRSIRIKC